MQLIDRIDDAVERRIHGLRGHPTVDRTMYVASDLADWSLIWHLVGVGQALLPGRRPGSAARLSAVLAAESLLVNGIIKSAFRRTRPVWAHEAPRPHRLRVPRSSSFPSGHASAAFTAAGILSARRADRLWPLYYTGAVVVSVSRCYVRIHHASDVLAGAALGVALASAVNRVLSPLD